MSEPVEPTELEALQFGGVPSGEMPDPEPEVVARAQKLINDAAENGDAGGRVWEAKPGEELVDTVRDTSVSDDDKLRFLAHVLGDQPYEKTYTLLGGRMRLCFRSISQRMNTRLIETIKTFGGSYFELLMIASLCWVESDGERSDTQFFKSPRSEDHNVNAYKEWMEHSLTRAQYHLIRDTFTKFDSELDLMLAKADDPDFWQTLS